MREHTAKGNLDLTIRPEQPADYHQIEVLLDSAFKGHDEAELVDRLRGTPEYINELTLVATRGDRILGFIMLSHVDLQQGDSGVTVLSLAPVAVLPEFHNMGVGGALIRESIELAKRRIEPLIVLLGHANYYPRFGFETASKYNIYPPVDWTDEAYMIYRLPHWSPDLKGKIVYSPAWQIE